MREYRRVSRPAAIGIVLVLLASAGAALASTTSGQLRVRGPVDLEGPSHLIAHNPVLLLRDPGTDVAEGVTMTFRAPQLIVTSTQIQETCLRFGGSPARVGQMSLPPSLGLRSPLPTVGETVDAAVSALPLPSTVSQAVAPWVAKAQATAASADRAIAGPGSPGAFSAPATGALPIPLPVPECLEMGPGRSDRSDRIHDAVVTIHPTDPYYTIAWIGDGDRASSADPSRGASAASAALARLDATDATIEWMDDDESVPMASSQDSQFGPYDSPISLPANSVSAVASGAQGTFTGLGTIKVFRAEALVEGVAENGSNYRETFSTGETRSSGYALGHDEKREVSFLTLEASPGAGGSGSGHYSSPAQVRLVSEAMTSHLEGSLAVPEARGQLSVGNDTYPLDGSALKIGGQLALRFEGLTGAAAAPDPSATAASKRGNMLLTVGGDVNRLDTAATRTETPSSAATTAAAVSILAVLAGALAYFWPSLKFLAAPLYTRIAPDAVLMHGARENIYRLIREEPGIHAHEVASRLNLGWGTAVYHLKLLERNSLVVARHEGRYKRFFVTGDQRIQHREAVALLRNPTSRSIATAIATQPGRIQKELCLALGVSPSLASWHLQRLEASGLVTSERLGRAVRYAPGPAWTELAQMDSDAADHRAGASGPAATAA